MILIIGNTNDPQVAILRAKIQQHGEQAVCFDTREFPYTTRMSFFPMDLESGQLCIGAERFDFSQIQAVFWRTFLGIKTGEYEDRHLQEIAWREIDSALGNLVRSLDCLWVNPYSAIEQHRYKGHQLALLHDAGLRIPATLITNDGDAVREFSAKHNGNLIYKPVRGGAYTVKLTETDLTDERLLELDEAPVQFQEFIPGDDIRVYLVQDQLFAAEILTDTLDFRRDPQAKINPITLPDTVAKDCFTLAKTLGLIFAGIDIRRTQQGEYVFLEGNPSPMFAYFEGATGYPISDCLVNLLLRG